MKNKLIKQPMKEILQEQNIMTRFKMKTLAGAMFALLWGFAGPANATFFVQCPGDADGDAVIDAAVDPNDSHYPDGAYSYPDDNRCFHVTAGDGWVNLAGRPEPYYFFSYHDVTGVPEADVAIEGYVAHENPAPTIIQDEGDLLYVTLSNVGMLQRPDLADTHSIHYHGFPEASTTFDGVPEMTISINEGASLTYFYKAVEPGTFFWHCHVEASEHMQMGMIGNLWVRPAQNRLPDGYVLNPGPDQHVHSNPDNLLGTTDRNQDNPIDGDKYVFNDGDGTTRYDVEYPVQITTWDPVFHDASRDTQPLPFIEMDDTLAMINGRVYPDTIIETPFPSPVETLGYGADTEIQPVNTMIRATQGEQLMLRLSNVSTTDQLTVRTLGLTMKVVGAGGRIFRGRGEVDGLDMFYETSTIELSGGDARSVIIDTTDAAPGTYFLYTTHLEFLSNDTEDYGGAMTEIQIAAAP
ncbi:MAG: multicopper oxidase domain-containing protein [Gammaproteobacteria bacterium]|jgi:FtsP/CotA-like multicopper oxidase with cupredoxin domain|nr:hypothetical protein [Chromatiales bacterium]MDP6674312.1 multicopper oxidase domain-containing protein [Gammaproteobacteria bacterium]